MTRPVAIVLGAMVMPDGSPSATLLRRGQHAAHLWKKGHVDLIITTGGMSPSGRSEAEVLAGILKDAGVPHNRIRLEEQSRTTWENISLSCPLLPKDAEVVLVTDAYHGPRARMMARRLGLTARSSSPSFRSMSKLVLLKNTLREGAALILHLMHCVARNR